MEESGLGTERQKLQSLIQPPQLVGGGQMWRHVCRQSPGEQREILTGPKKLCGPFVQQVERMHNES